jgi:hypothetical protein
VERGKSFLFQRETAFQFELGAHPEGDKMQTIWSARMWEKDMLLRVSGDHEIHVKDEALLAECKEKQICKRRQNMAKEVLTAGSKNLYEILNLNMEEVRGKPLEEQNKILKGAYHSQLRRWHPDRNPENGDSAICQEIIFAYKILKDPEARAAYNNVADYDKGWFSKARYNAIFKPECYSAEQKKQYKKRIGLFLLSVLLIAGGVGLTFLTAGMAASVVLGVTAASGALIGGGISTGLRTINRESIEKGCSLRKYFTSLVIGAVGGAAMGVGVAGIAMFLGGAAKLAFKAAQLSLERQITTRMATTAFRGFITSLTNNIDAILAGGEKTSWKQFILHVLFNAWLGGIVGLTGGFAENMIQDVVSAESALATIESVYSNARDAIVDTTTAAVETFANYVKERFDDDVENKSMVDHIKNGAKQAAIAVGKNSTVAAAKAANKEVNDGGKATGINGESSNQNKVTDDIYEETNDETRKDTNNTTTLAKNVAKTTEKEGINTNSEYKDRTGASDDIGEEVEDSNNATKEDECEENIDDDDKTECTGGNDSSAESEKKQTKSHVTLPNYKSLISETNNSDEEQTVSDSDDSTECVKPILMKYFSEGYWFSKMLVDYKENGETKHYEVKDSESSIQIPNKATKIKVRFQVMRFLGTWCDVKKYDRFKKCWIEPNQPHTFEYNTPVNRTYTLSGNLYYEAVMNITGDYDNLNEI